jgi:hypothetical protein
MLRAALALALAALVKSDYLLTQFFPGDGGCVGEARPAEITNGACFYAPQVDPNNPFSRFTCISPTAYNTSSYSTISCTGALINSDVRQVGGCESGGDRFGRGFINHVCLSETLDPETWPIPDSIYAVDQYNIVPGSSGAATCPPTVGPGVVFSSRFYPHNIALGVCEPTSRFPYSIIISCNPYNAHTLRLQVFPTVDCSGPEDPSSYDESGCTKESETVVSLFNPGTLCMSPPPASSTSGASLLSPAGLIGVGVGIGLTVAALAFAAHALFRNYYLPLGTDAGQLGRARSLPSNTSREAAAAAAASLPLLASGKAARAGGQFKM